MCTVDVLNVNGNQMKRLLNNIRRRLNHVCLLERLKSYQGWEKPHAKTMAWSYDMEGHAPKRVERHRELENKSGAALQSLI